MNEVIEFQRRVADRLKFALNRNDVNVGWHAFPGLGKRIYQPIVDIAVGPYAIEGQYGTEYTVMVNNHQLLINTWTTFFLQNWQSVIGDHYIALPPRSPTSHEDFVGSNANENARCCIAIEIENETSRKHLMGSIINAGALGRVGILIAWQPKVLRAAIRMRQYFDFLLEVKKRSFNMGGVIIISKEQFADSLNVTI